MESRARFLEAIKEFLGRAERLRVLAAPRGGAARGRCGGAAAGAAPAAASGSASVPVPRCRTRRARRRRTAAAPSPSPWPASSSATSMRRGSWKGTASSTRYGRVLREGTAGGGTAVNRGAWCDLGYIGVCWGETRVTRFVPGYAGLCWGELGCTEVLGVSRAVL